METASVAVHMAAILLALLNFSTAVEASAPSKCTAELVAMSACLPTMAAPPEDVDPIPTIDCCKGFTAALDSAATGVPCACHLVRDPQLMGVPINVSRLVALSSYCDGYNPAAAEAFVNVCGGTKQLPPLRDQYPEDDSKERNMTHPDASDPPGSGNDEVQQSPAFSPDVPSDGKFHVQMSSACKVTLSRRLIYLVMRLYLFCFKMYRRLLRRTLGEPETPYFADL